MNLNPFFAILAALCLWASHACAYEVWMGTHLSTSEMANDLSAWVLTASKLEGFNVNRAPHDTDPASNNDYRTIFAQFANAGDAMTEFARSQATRDPEKTDELAFPSIAQRLEEIFNFESSYGYNLSILMFYDERGTFQGTEYLYEWTEIEIQYLRDWLDSNGHADVELMWNVRNNSVRNQQLSANPLVDSVEIEASTTALLNNTNNQITFFEWFWNNPATANKRIALQIPRTLDSLNQIRGTRRVVQMLGGIIGYGEDGMRSDRLIFLPVTYNDNFPYIPETVSGGSSYTNTLTSIALSLIEQRDLFEGRLTSLPTVADADSLVRTVPPTISDLSSQVVRPNAGTGAITFSVGDADTPLGSLTLTALSSNPVLVPPGEIVFGGSGANRSLSITPSIGQTGVAEITVEVSDGMWVARSTFRLVVGAVLFSASSDASVRDNLVAVDQNSSTTLLGAGGSSPYIDRCTVYAFQLPDLGAEPDPFTSAFFSFNVEAKEGTLKDNDLYGLGRRTVGTVLGSDYYGQTSTSDPSDATRLQANIFTNATPLGLVETSPLGSAALVDYLNAQYASGVGVGDFVFLRLNTAEPKIGINRATLTMSEGGVASPVDSRPRIIYSGRSVPTDFGGPVAHWPLDEGSGTLAGDATGNGYSGTLLNGATWGSDATRDSFVTFDGTDDRILTPFTYALSSSDDFTWAWWANPNAATHSGSIMLGNRYPQPGAGGGSFEFIKLTPSHGQFASTNDVSQIERHEYGGIATGVWHHYAMVKDGTSYQWYIDGVPQGAAETINYSETARIPFLIGGDSNGTANPNEHFEGSIDDVVLYRRALSTAEVEDVRDGKFAPAEPMSGVMQGLEADADVREDAVIVNLGAASLVPGRSGASGGFDRSTVLVFQLPHLGAQTDPFITATLSFNVEETSASPPGVDLYGLGKRVQPEVLASDYYGETATPDLTSAVLIQSNILNGTTGTGMKNSSASSALAAYLNTQYEGGNGIGDYVFVRLSTNAPITSLQRHFITSADASADNPQITYRATAPQDYDTWLGTFTFQPGADLSPDGDADGDSQSNWFEYRFGLDPTDSVLISPITTQYPSPPGTFTYTRRDPALSASDYQVWISEDLSHWINDEAALQEADSDGSIQNVTVTLSETLRFAPRLFVRVVVE